MSIPKLNLQMNIAAFAFFLGVLLLTLRNQSWMQYAFSYFSYYIILALTTAWVWALINLWRHKKPDPILFLRSHWKGIIVSFVLASVVFISVPRHYRVLSDETNLLSVAKSMTFYKHVNNVTEGKWYYEMFWPVMESATEKRPFLFPFFVSLLHSLFGYRAENVFVLNYFVLWALLFLLYLLIRSYLGQLLAFASLVLVAAQPIISLSAASASFELFNALFILAAFISLRYFLRDPASPSFAVLVLGLIMLANIRYESILFFVVFMAALLMGGYIRSGFWGRPWCALVPFFFLPWIWQRVIMLGTVDSNLSGGSWIKAFELGHAGQNTALFFKYILDISGQSGYAGMINLIGIMAMVYFLAMLWIKRKESIDRGRQVLVAACAVSMFALFVVVILYQGGINDHPMNGRLYMPILIVLSVLPVCFLAEVIKDRKRLAIPVLMGAVASFIYYYPIAVEDRLTNNLVIVREFRFVEDFLKKNADKNALIICGRPGQLIVDNYGAISFETANQDINEILEQYHNRLFSTIYAIQAISYSTRSPLEDNMIDPRYQLETVSELQMSGDYFFRISRAKISDQ